MKTSHKNLSNHKKKAKRKTGKAPKGERPFKGKRGNTSHTSPALRDVSVLVITGITEEGELVAQPAKWDEKHRPPHIVITEPGKQKAAEIGDRVLAKMHKVKANLYQAQVIRVLPSEQPQPVLGVFVPTAEGGFIEPISRKMKESFIVAREDTFGAVSGELVSGVTLAGVPGLGMSYAKITERLGRLDSPKAASLIASNMHSLPSVFSSEAAQEAENAAPPVLGKGRVDLRDIPLVTIDGEDARDFDDAVFAEKNGTGWHLLVAIADVAYYVAEGSALDAEAFERGNSVYFPDRVIPMLPERLSNGLCSLMLDQDRYCLAVHIWIDAEGNMLRYQFVRGLMRSQARLTYEQVENVILSVANDPRLYVGDHSALPHDDILNLNAAYAALAHERDQRSALNLNVPEFKISFDEEGNVAAIKPRERLESHRLIEAFMIAANVAAADYLLKNKAPGIYRTHEPPSEDKTEELKNLLQMSGYSLHTGAGIKAGHFNRILNQVEGKPEAYMVNIAILRSQMQAYYSPDCVGHFGLALQKYCHFTSPIRRYADLVVHRSLAALIDHDQKPEKNNLADIALHISNTERRAMLAERDASDRYKVSYMSKHIGSTFSGVIVSLNEYGLFVSLNDTGVTGFIPVRNLGGDFYQYDKRHASFKGRRTHQVFQIGMPMIIKVQTANATTGSLIFELAKPPEPIEPLRPKIHKHSRKKHSERRHKSKSPGST